MKYGVSVFCFVNIYDIIDKTEEIYKKFRLSWRKLKEFILKFQVNLLYTRRNNYYVERFRTKDS